MARAGGGCVISRYWIALPVSKCATFANVAHPTSIPAPILWLCYFDSSMVLIAMPSRPPLSYDSPVTLTLFSMNGMSLMFWFL